MLSGTTVKANSNGITPTRRVIVKILKGYTTHIMKSHCHSRCDVNTVKSAGLGRFWIDTSFTLQPRHEDLPPRRDYSRILKLLKKLWINYRTGT